MPQLNPNPWFLILAVSWLAYLMLLPKFNNLKMMNEPLTKNNKYLLMPWSWPWI